jgi:hypothetical protein
MNAKLMNAKSIATLVAAALIASTISSLAGPCSTEIDATQARVDARLAAKGAAGPSATEGLGALTHRQPTPDSIAAAEEKLGEVPAKTVQEVTQAMARARAADDAGDRSVCEQALAEVRRVLGQ